MPLISRRSFLAGTAALSACGTKPTVNPNAPNVLIILLDQLRASALSAYGNTNIQTPAMDAFLNDGVRFDTAMAANPLCGPARASLLTGMYPGHVGVPNNDRPITPGTATVANTFRAAGYKAGYVGKWHLARGKAQYPASVNGFDDHFQGYNERYAYRASYWFTGKSTEPEYPAPRDLFEPTYQTTQALDVLKRWRKDRFLLMVSYVPPHPPKNWRGDWAADFPDGFPYGVDPKVLALRKNVPAWAEWEHDPPPAAEGSMPSKRKPKRGPGARPYLRNYYGAILSMEPEIQRLLTGLTTLGLDTNTVVVFTSDHGDLAGSHGRYLKQKPYAESVHIPLGFRWKGTLAPRLSSTPISQIDIFPTLAGLCGVSVPGNLHGRDLSSVLLEPKELSAEVMSGCHLHNPRRTWWQVRTPRFAYTEYISGSPTPLLFDMQTDPFQMTNLAEEPSMAEEKSRLAKILAARREGIGV